MRRVPATPRVEAALRATPMPVMAGVVANAMAQGRATDAVALAAAAGLTLAIGNDVAAAPVAVGLAALRRRALG